ncbi:MAG: class I SAM-dependent rRNA methyltransferase, partial [Duncaniella sp.]|nr:class I SAM-dependent rRNA methyltransferase [Duncaniella sp.]
MQNYKTITLKRGKEESLLRFHPWVFSGAIATLPDGLEEGDTVRVSASDGQPLGVGHYEIGSIAVRMLSPREEVIDETFYSERLARAWALREKLGLIRPDNSTFRLVHGEGDFLPGCVIDVYGDTAVLQAHSPGMHYARHIIAEALTRLPDAGIKNVYYKSETTLPYKARLDPVNDYIIGSY